MANPATVAGNLQLTGTSKITGGVAGGSQVESVQIGQNSFPALNPQVSQATATSTVGQATKHYQTQVTVGSSAQQTVALTGLTDGLGDAIVFTNVKMVLAVIVSPDGAKKIAMGPQGVASGWYSPFVGTTTNGATLASIGFTEVGWLGSTLATTGYTAGAGNYQLVLQNMSATTCACQLLIWGS